MAGTRPTLDDAHVTGPLEAPRTPTLSPQQPLPVDEARRLAGQHGLREMGVRPPLVAYVRQLWRRRTFIRVLATSKAYARNQNTYLGQVWALLNPVLNATVYVVIFGLIIGTRAGIENVIAFIVVGTFTFRFFEQSVSGGAKSITGNMNLVRSMQFPRAVLPVSGVLSELATLVPALVVMCLISLLSGLVPGFAPVPITWRWFLLVPAVLLLWVFNTGCAFLMARWVAIAPDLQNVIPFAMRFLMYGSGVLFSIDHYVTNPALASVLGYQPVAVYLYLVRSAILSEPSIPPDPAYWAWGVGWAVAFVVVGFLAFWRGEERYGRD